MVYVHGASEHGKQLGICAKLKNDVIRNSQVYFVENHRRKLHRRIRSQSFWPKLVRANLVRGMRISRRKIKPYPRPCSHVFREVARWQKVRVFEPRNLRFFQDFFMRAPLRLPSSEVFPTRRANPQTSGARCIQGTGAPGTRLVTGGARVGFNPPTRSPVRVRDA